MGVRVPPDAPAFAHSGGHLTWISLQDIDDVLDALCAAAEFRQLEPEWIPPLTDPDDEPILQMAVEAKVPIIVTRNLGHLKPAESFGVEVLTPAQFLGKLRADI